jgi:acyl carrier protein
MTSARPDEARAELKSTVRAILQRLKLIEGNVIVPLDSLAIVLVCAEIEDTFGVDLAAESLDRESFSSFDALVEVVVQNTSRAHDG